MGVKEEERKDRGLRKNRKAEPYRKHPSVAINTGNASIFVTTDCTASAGREEPNPVRADIYIATTLNACKRKIYIMDHKLI